MTRTRARVLGSIDPTLVECAADLVPLLAEHAVAGERAAWVSPAVVKAMRNADLFRTIAPKRVGGGGATMATQIAVAETLAQGCPSAAWVQSLCNINAWAASKLGPQARSEIFFGSYEFEACDHWPMGMALTSVITGPVIGAVKAMYADIAANASTRGISYTTYEHQIDSSVVLRSLAEASLHIDTARHHLYGVAASVDAAGETATPPSAAEAGYARGACGHAVQVLRSAADRLVSIGGASSFATSSRVQKLWRDVNVGSRHAFIATDPSLEVMGRAEFGLEQIMEIV